MRPFPALFEPTCEQRRGLNTTNHVVGVYSDAAGKPTVLLWNPWGSHIMVSWETFKHDVMSVVMV